MKNRVLALFCALVLLFSLSACGGEPPAPVELTTDTVTYEGEGYVLTYPACFTMVQETPKMVNFTVSGGTMAFTVSVEENPYGAQKIEDYPDMMGIYSGVTILNDHSFGVEKHQEGVLSAYYLYAMTADTTCLLEYNYGGSEEQRQMAALFAIDPV